MTRAIEIISLTKYYPKHNDHIFRFNKQFNNNPSIDNIDLHVNEGEILGLVGPNGAGKTTLIKILSTLIKPTSGTAILAGCDLRDEIGVKKSIGLVTSDERSFYWRLTGKQNLQFFAVLAGVPSDHIDNRISQISKILGLQDLLSKRFSTYSAGIRQRIAIARALLNTPPILLLDEPSKGLDPATTQQLYRLIQQLSNTLGTTIVLTTHNLSDVERYCDRIAIMDKGKIVAIGTLQELYKLINTPGMDEPSPTIPNHLHLLEGIYERLIMTQSTKVADEEINPGNVIKKRIDTSIKTSSKPNIIKIAWAFIKRDCIEEASYRFSFFLQFISVFITTGIFYFISLLFRDTPIQYLDKYGGDYFSYVLMGLAFSGYFSVGLSSFSSALRQAQTTGTLEAMFATPNHPTILILCSAIWDYLLTTLRVIIYLAIGISLIGFHLGNANLLASLIVLILTIPTFSGIGILAASFILVLKRGEPITWLVNSLSGLLGGIYFPIHMLPPLLQIPARFLPVTYSLDAMRLALLQGASLGSLLPQILILSIFCLIFVPIGLLGFRWAIHIARTEGSLTHY